MQPHRPQPERQNGATVEERRRQDREEYRGPLRLTLDTEQLQGTTENISGVGVLFFTEDDLRVTVELEDGVRRTGRLVRVQRMGLENTGFAVEFDSK